MGEMEDNVLSFYINGLSCRRRIYVDSYLWKSYFIDAVVIHSFKKRINKTCTDVLYMWRDLPGIIGEMKSHTVSMKR